MSSFPTPVAKPSTAGKGQLALSRTPAPYINLRNGPGTNYRDVGDIRNNTVIVYYPASRIANEWIWVEQGTVSGWISNTVISFEHITAAPPIPAQQATPYDGKIAVWHWKGDSIAENTIDEVARNIKAVAPNVSQIWVKISDATERTGAQWQGYWDTKRSLAIDGPSSIDRWVQTLAKYNMEFHAWCVPKGSHLEAETNILIQACTRPGVKSLILDVEPYDGFWQGGRDGIRPFMTRIRRAIPGSFHIGMSIDPRKAHYDSIFPAEWFPFVNSIHPQDYWATFRRTPEETLRETFEVWGSYGKPIIPVLDSDAEPEDMATAITLATQRHRARGLSWWRLGTITPTGWNVINTPINGTPVPNPTPPTDNVGVEITIKPEDANFTKGRYTEQVNFSEFQNTWGWKAFYKITEPQTSKVWGRWTPRITVSGKYEIAAFIPGRHSSTQNARFKINSVKGATGEIIVNLNQSRYSNEWVTLGVYELDKNTANAGTVFLNDLTGETGKEIVFDAIRFRQLVTTPTPSGKADGFDTPIGTAAERRSTTVWPGTWRDASPFARLYFVGTPQEAYHTGADLNMPSDADAHTPVYSAASGIVVFASRLPIWGNVVIIKHDPLATNGRVYYTRYGHVESLKVKVGDRVTRGQQVASVGNAFGAYAYHLHFDVSPTTILESNPEHWPARNLDALLANYVDPRDFILKNRPR
ncbi:MAG: peptidoglycan DD-metalloendopeptidase family protein [Chloroflexi bacterium]|nr:peptidoglycan DD-metalloendopeptidase family protein [Chloroflexota bacterium]MCC6892106.1 peptidoglycan DD-metalloendopeptidase family protein [Anaerolineae bacterium]